MVGRGASDPDANSNVSKVTRLLWEGFGFGWAETAYSGVTFPLVEPGLEHAARLGYSASSCFPISSSPAFWCDRIYDATDAVAARHPEIEFVKAPYLNDHPQVIATFEERLRADPHRRHRDELPDVQVPHAGAGLRGRGGRACRKATTITSKASAQRPTANTATASATAMCKTMPKKPKAPALSLDPDAPVKVTVAGHHDHGHDHGHGHHHHDHGHDHDHTHAPYPHADHPLGPRSMQKT